VKNREQVKDTWMSQMNNMGSTAKKIGGEDDGSEMGSNAIKKNFEYDGHWLTHDGPVRPT